MKILKRAIRKAAAGKRAGATGKMRKRVAKKKPAGGAVRFGGGGARKGPAKRPVKLGARKRVTARRPKARATGIRGSRR